MTDKSTPTEEQTNALQMAKQGDSFKIMAYAGSGKTTTLTLISEHLSGKGLYLAFNRSIATEAQGKFPAHVKCQTFHSLAYRHVDRAITAKVSLPRLTPALLASEFKLPTLTVERTFDQGSRRTTTLYPFHLALWISEGLNNFCKTSSEYPAPRHITPPSWINDADRATLQEMLYPALEHLWQQAIDPRHQQGISHDIYLKLWTLSNPIIPADFILFDEAQDADPLMMGALIKQPVQTIYVGDPHQQIYEWRGAVNAMKRLPYPQTLLTQSFRFGQDVADVANVFLKALQETVPLRGDLSRSSKVAPLPAGEIDVILCRTNANAIGKLLAGQQLGYKVALQADSGRILRFCQGANNLMAGRSATGVPELAYFTSWKEVQEFSETKVGQELKSWVKLIDEYGTATIIKAINHLVDAKSADYMVSTAHKSKGLEWGRVCIDDDFFYDASQHSIKISPEELRLLYVACTRAKSVLDTTGIQEILKSLLNKKLIYV